MLTGPRCTANGVSRCDARAAAEARGELVPDRARGAWVLAAAPLRTMSREARYWALIDRAGQFPHHDHTGEPYTLADCPFCGGELPPPAPLTQQQEQGDGWRD